MQADLSGAYDRDVRRRWVGLADAYARSFAALCGHTAPALLDAAGVPDGGAPGTRLLDVGTGPGTVAALAVRRGAEVTAVDPEQSMIELAERTAPGATVGRGVLPDLPFAGEAFDAVVANFVVNHVGDPPAAVAGLRRVARPGGRVAVTIWPHPHPPLQRLWYEVMAEIGLEPVEVPAGAPVERSPEGLAGLLRGAGLTEVSSTTLTWVHRADPAQWWTGPANGMGALGRALTNQPPELVAEARRCYTRLAARYLDGDGVLALPTAALLATGTR